MGLRIIDRARTSPQPPAMTESERQSGLTAQARHWLMARGTHDHHGEAVFVEKFANAHARQMSADEILGMAESVRARIRAMNAGEHPPHQTIGLATLLDLL